MGGRLAPVLVLLGGLCLAPGAGAAGSAGVCPGPPFAGRGERVSGLWARGQRLEREEAFADSARLYEEVVGLAPDLAHVYWRIARNQSLAGARLPLADREGRLRAFGLAERWGARCAEVDPACAECLLYQFVGMSRAATTRGVLAAARSAAAMAALLDRALALRPTHADNDWNLELGNLYYAAGIFYRALPETALAEWTLGVRGDRRRSLEYLRRALATSPRRVDYHVELGAALLCLGAKTSDPQPTAEGISVLERVPDLPELQSTDPIDREHAGVLIGDPDAACGYGREDWIARGVGGAR